MADSTMQHHQTQQLQEQPTVSQPLRPSQHADLARTSEAAGAMLQTGNGTDAADGCQQEIAAVLSPDDPRAGLVGVRHDGMWGMADPKAVDQEPEVTPNLL